MGTEVARETTSRRVANLHRAESPVTADLYGLNPRYFSRSWCRTSGYVKIAIEHGPVEIVDLSTKNGDFP